MCGVFGIYGYGDAAAVTALGLHALQHRGQEAAGIVTFDGARFHSHRAVGRVGENFSTPQVLASLRGHAAIGHNRYRTAGTAGLANSQPLLAELSAGAVAVSHNGNLTNAVTLRRRLAGRGATFRSDSDTEVLLHLLAEGGGERAFTSRLAEALGQVEGAYALALLTEKALFGVRDPYGVRPLALGEMDGAFLLASESCAFDLIGARFVREVAPGEIVIADADGLRSVRAFPARERKLCMFEHIYFSRPDSVMEDVSIYAVRHACGRRLARAAPAKADIVVPVPDSGVAAALGYAEQSRIPYAMGIVRNHYVGRTFIEPADGIRHLGVRLKHNANRHAVGGKRVVLVDDSIVRGATSRKIVALLRAAGARELHMRIASPPVTHPCFYGIDTPTSEELLAFRSGGVAAMARELGVDSLAFLTLKDFSAAARSEGALGKGYCDACFSGNYSLPLIDEQAQSEARRQMTLPLAAAGGAKAKQVPEKTQSEES